MLLKLSEGLPVQEWQIHRIIHYVALASLTWHNTSEIHQWLQGGCGSKASLFSIQIRIEKKKRSFCSWDPLFIRKDLFHKSSQQCVLGSLWSELTVLPMPSYKRGWESEQWTLFTMECATARMEPRRCTKSRIPGCPFHLPHRPMKLTLNFKRRKAMGEGGETEY